MLVVAVVNALKTIADKCKMLEEENKNVYVDFVKSIILLTHTVLMRILRVPIKTWGVLESIELCFESIMLKNVSICVFFDYKASFR